MCIRQRPDMKANANRRKRLIKGDKAQSARSGLTEKQGKFFEKLISIIITLEYELNLLYPALALGKLKILGVLEFSRGIVSWISNLQCHQCGHQPQRNPLFHTPQIS